MFLVGSDGMIGKLAWDLLQPPREGREVPAEVQHCLVCTASFCSGRANLR